MSDYWKTPVGIAERISMLSEDFTFRIYNNALAFTSEQASASIMWVGYPDACRKCEPYIGNTYRSGQYIPQLPKHPHCRCTWKIIL